VREIDRKVSDLPSARSVSHRKAVFEHEEANDLVTRNRQHYCVRLFDRLSVASEARGKFSKDDGAFLASQHLENLKTKSLDHLVGITYKVDHCASSRLVTYPRQRPGVARDVPVQIDTKQPGYFFGPRAGAELGQKLLGDIEIFFLRS
jgi:hypothetical protein